jgi:hypothetical protein
MKMYGGVEVQLYALLAPTLGIANWIGGRVGPRGGLDAGNQAPIVEPVA